MGEWHYSGILPKESGIYRVVDDDSGKDSDNPKITMVFDIGDGWIMPEAVKPHFNISAWCKEERPEINTKDALSILKRLVIEKGRQCDYEAFYVIREAIKE